MYCITQTILKRRKKKKEERGEREKKKKKKKNEKKEEIKKNFFKKSATRNTKQLLQAVQQHWFSDEVNANVENTRHELSLKHHLFRLNYEHRKDSQSVAADFYLLTP